MEISMLRFKKIPFRVLVVALAAGSGVTHVLAQDGGYRSVLAVPYGSESNNGLTSSYLPGSALSGVLKYESKAESESDEEFEQDDQKNFLTSNQSDLVQSVQSVVAPVVPIVIPVGSGSNAPSKNLVESGREIERGPIVIKNILDRPAAKAAIIARSGAQVGGCNEGLTFTSSGFFCGNPPPPPPAAYDPPPAAYYAPSPALAGSYRPGNVGIQVTNDTSGDLVSVSQLAPNGDVISTTSVTPSPAPYEASAPTESYSPPVVSRPVTSSPVASLPVVSPSPAPDPVTASVSDPVTQGSSAVAEETTAKVVEETTAKVVEKVVEETTAKVVEETTAKVVEKVVEETTEKVVEETTAKVVEETTAKVVEKVVEETTAKVVEETTEKVVEETTAKVVEETTAKVVEKVVEETTEKVVEKVVEETVVTPLPQDPCVENPASCVPAVPVALVDDEIISSRARFYGDPQTYTSNPSANAVFIPYCPPVWDDKYVQGCR
jgi:hypothetical protein